MPSALCAWHQMGSFSPGRLNTGRLPQPWAAHCRLRACSGNTLCSGETCLSPAAMSLHDAMADFDPYIALLCKL